MNRRLNKVVFNALIVVTFANIKKKSDINKYTKEVEDTLNVLSLEKQIKNTCATSFITCLEKMSEKQKLILNVRNQYKIKDTKLKNIQFAPYFDRKLKI